MNLSILFSMVQNTLNLTLMVKVWGKPRYKSTTIWRISAHTCCLNFADMLIKCNILMSRWNKIVPASSLNMHFTFETYFVRVYWVYEPRKRSHIFVRQSVWRQNQIMFFYMFTTTDVGFECEVNYYYVIVLTFWHNTELSSLSVSDMKWYVVLIVYLHLRSFI